MTFDAQREVADIRLVNLCLQESLINKPLIYSDLILCQWCLTLCAQGDARCGNWCLYFFLVLCFFFRLWNGIS